MTFIGFGHLRLVNVLGRLYSRFLGNVINPQTDVLVTVGAYLSLYYAFLGWLNQGDEVISMFRLFIVYFKRNADFLTFNLVMEPAYDSYVPQIKMAGGVPVPVVLELEANATSSAGYKLNIAELESKITSKTKMLVLNNPHNPTGKLYTKEELLSLAEIVKKHDLLVIADEVYEWHIYPGSHEMIRFGMLFCCQT